MNPPSMSAPLTALERYFPSIDEDVVDDLRRQLARDVKRVCPSWLASHGEDIVQAALIRVVRLTGGENETTFSSSYLQKVAVSATIDEIRRHRRRSEHILDDVYVDRLAQPRPGPEERAIGRQMGRAIRDSLARLGEDRRLAVTLHLQGHSVPEAAQYLGWSSKRVANLTYRGLRDLRRGLAARGFACVQGSNVA